MNAVRLPQLPGFISVTAVFLLLAASATALAQDGSRTSPLPFNDLVAVSFYPFFVSESPDVAFKWLTEHFDPFGKPYAMVETNDTAERLEFPKSRFVLNGTPEKQAAYVRTLLDLAERRCFRFVVFFIHQDYDALWETIKGSAPELFMAWRDCGLIDERGRPRPAYAAWREYFNRPFQGEGRVTRQKWMHTKSKSEERAQRFRDLLVWQKGMDLARVTYRVTQSFPVEEKFGLVAPMRRCAVSIPSNIAEGQARHTTGEFIQFSSHAEGSLAELYTQLRLAVDLTLCPEAAAPESFGLIEELRKMLNALRRKLVTRH